MANEYMTLAEAAKVIGITRPTVHHYIKKLNIKTHKYEMNKNSYMAVADVERIKAVREKPWTVEDEEDTGKREAIKDAA